MVATHATSGGQDATRVGVSFDRSIAVLVGSPRKGASERLAELVVEGIRSAGVQAEILKVSELVVAGCNGCDGCMGTGRCVKHDGFDMVEATLARAAALVVVSPVYFTGPPSQLKALYDRFQCHWVRRYVLGQTAAAKRPAALCVVREGGDPFGYEPLVTITRSVLNIADFKLGDVFDFIAKGPGNCSGSAPATSMLEEADLERARSIGSAFAQKFVEGACL